MTLRITAALVVLALTLTALACGGGPGAGSRPGGPPSGVPNPPFLGEIPEDAYKFNGTGVHGGTMVMSIEASPKSWNPISANEASTTQLTNGPMYAGLMSYDNVDQVETYGLAKAFETSPDGKVWTYTLRKGVKWSDGAPFTADDVLFNFEMIFDKDEKTAVPSSVKDLFVQADGSFPKVEKVDDYTVRFTLLDPSPLMNANVGSVYLVPKHKWETAYRNGTFKESLGLQTDPNDVVVCGPYRLKEFTTDQRVVLERNPYYWKVDSEGKRLPYIDRVIILIVPDFNTSTAKFQAGETDMMRQVRPEDMDLLKRSEAEKDFKVYDLGPGLNTVYLAFNQNPGRGASGTPYVDPVKLAWFTNKTFRQAVSYGIDRDGLIKTVFNGLGVPIYSLCSPSNKVWYDDAATKKYPYDPDKARAMLAEIGMTDRDGDGIVEDSKGNPVRFRVETNVENNTRVNVANFIADNLRKIGLQAELDPKPFNQLIVELQDSHSFDAIVLGWQTGVPPDPVQMKNILLSSGRSHQWNPNQKTPATPGEKRVDELILEISRTLDLETRKKLHAELLSVWTDEVWEIELVAANYFVAAKNRFGNFRPSFMPMYTYWNIEELYLTK